MVFHFVPSALTTTLLTKGMEKEISNIENQFGEYKMALKAYHDLFGDSIYAPPYTLNEYVIKAGMKPLTEKLMGLHLTYRQAVETKKNYDFYDERERKHLLEG